MAGSRRWTALGAAFGLTPTVWTGLFVLLDKLSLPAWTAVAVAVASPIADGRLGVLGMVDPKAGPAFEVLITRVPNGFRAVVRRRCR